MADLIPLQRAPFAGEVQQGVSARVLYTFLELNPSVWARWARRNIVQNPFALEHVDWEGFLPDVENRPLSVFGGRPTQDYVLSLDFAKRLSMMARSAKGEEARHYFLQCERIARQPHQLPPVHDARTEIAIQTLVRLDEAEYRLAFLEHQERERQAALIALQADTITSLQQSRQADTKAELALTNQQWLTIRKYCYLHSIDEHAFAPSERKAYGAWLTYYCREQGIPVDGQPIADRQWETEHSYHVETIKATLPGWLARRHAQPLLQMVPRAKVPRRRKEA